MSLSNEGTVIIVKAAVIEKIELSSSPMYFLFDIGATKMRMAASADGISFGEPTIEDTPQDFEEAMARIAAVARSCSGGKKIHGAAGGVAGLLNEDRTRLLSAPHISGWVGRPIAESMQKLVGAPVEIANDTAIVGLGESTAGAGQGFEIVVYVTVSTGVNGVRIIDKSIDRARYGFEIGHQIIDIDRTLCVSCPAPGTLENHVSGTAIEARFGKKPYEITDPAVWEEVAQWLAVGLHNTILHWSPDVVVLGGSMMKNIGISIERVSYNLNAMSHVYSNMPPIVGAALGDIGGLWGALAFAEKRFGTLRGRKKK